MTTKYSIFTRLWWKLTDFVKRHIKDNAGCTHCTGECEKHS